MLFVVICILIILKELPGIARVAGATRIKMLFQFKKINNESGVVLFIVLMVAIIIMIFSVGILTQSMNEINYAQQQIDQTTCDQLKKGVLWNSQAQGSLEPGYSTNINGRTYTIVTASVGGPPPIQENWQINCSYDTF